MTKAELINEIAISTGYDKRTISTIVESMMAHMKKAVADGECDLGVLICTTGIGMSMVANKIPGVRAALCSDSLSASLTRQHNNANVLVMGAGIVGPDLAMSILDTFMDTPFSEAERHIRRVNKIEG